VNDRPLEHEWTTPEETARMFPKAAPGIAFCKRCGRFNYKPSECRKVNVELRQLRPYSSLSAPVE
jgi:hypothetical protein